MPDPISLLSGHSSKALLTDAAIQTNKDSEKVPTPYRVVVIVWRILIIVVSFTGIVLNSISISDFFAKLLYFTIQSNVILIIGIGYALWAIARNRPGLPPIFKGAITVYITITFLVYNLILANAPGSPPLPAGTVIVPLIGGTPASDLVHIIAPTMAILDWLLFDTHGKLRWRYPLQWLIYPVAYLAFVLVRGLLVTGPFVYPNLHYPYSFLDVDYIGYGGVALNALIYGIAFWLIGLVFVLMDRMIARFKHHTSPKE